MRVSTVLLVPAVLCASLCAQIEKPSPIPSRNKKPAEEAPKKKSENTPQSGESQRSIPADANTGTACFYKPKADSGNTESLGPAHATLVTGTKVRVTNLANSKAVVVTVTGHGNLGDRIISV